jgi:hypothetical protein
LAPYSSFASPYANKPMQAKLRATAITKAVGGQARRHNVDGALGERLLSVVITDGISIPSLSHWG